MSKLPASLDIERVFLASLIKNPELIPEYLEYLSDDLFYNDVHKIIYSALKSQFASKKTVDPVILSDYISNLGLAHLDEINIPDYIVTICIRNAVTKDKIETYFRDCYKYKIARSVIQSCRNTESDIRKSINSPIGDIIRIAESGVAKAVTSAIQDDYKPVDIYEDMLPFLEEIAQKKNIEGIKTPFKTWNRWWGPLTLGDLTVIAAPPKTGKSTILNYLADSAFCSYNAGKKIKVLVLDTELETHRVRTRKVAALADVNESYIRDGRWMNNQELTDAVLDKKTTFEKRANGSFKHLYVANVPIDKICSMVRRWAATDTEPDDYRIVIYDYLKVTGESISGHNQEYQVMGEKCDSLKHLMSEVNAAGIACIQTNAQMDVAMSQRIKWFASNIFMFRRKTPEEISKHGEEFGTHILSPLELRNLGDDWDNEQYVKEAKDSGITYTKNYLNIEVKNFNMFERGTYQDIVNKGKKQIDIHEQPRGKRKMVEEELI